MRHFIEHIQRKKCSTHQKADAFVGLSKKSQRRRSMAGKRSPQIHNQKEQVGTLKLAMLRTLLIQ
jgi:hypothetical protein